MLMLTVVIVGALDGACQGAIFSEAAVHGSQYTQVGAIMHTHAHTVKTLPVQLPLCRAQNVRTSRGFLVHAWIVLCRGQVSECVPVCVCVCVCRPWLRAQRAQASSSVCSAVCARPHGASQTKTAPPQPPRSARAPHSTLRSVPHSPPHASSHTSQSYPAFYSPPPTHTHTHTHTRTTTTTTYQTTAMHTHRI